MGMRTPGFEAEPYLREFESYLKSRNKEESTIKLYLTEIRQFCGWLCKREKTLLAATQKDLLSVRDEMYESGMKPSTINKTMSVLSSFFKWAKEQNYVACNFAEHVRFLEPKKQQPPRWLSREEEERLLEYAAKERNPFKRTRNEALIYVMLYAGLRVDEVSQLRLDSLQGHELVVFDNGEEARRVPINENTRSKLEAWLQERSLPGKSGYSDSPYLFVTERSGCMQPRSIQFVVEGLSEKLGFPVWGQILRHTYCRKMAEQGLPVEEVRRRAGHKSVMTTWQYFDHESGSFQGKGDVLSADSEAR
jgi:integrase/recombinase XerC